MSRHKHASVTAEPVADPDKLAEELVAEHGASPEDDAIMAEGEEPPHDTTLTGVTMDTLQSGLHPGRAPEQVPGEDDLLRAGDPDVNPLENLYSGEEAPGASQPTPDQNNVDEIGRYAGLAAEDPDGGDGLRSAAEVLEERDAHRWELDPRSAGRPGDGDEASEDDEA